MIKAVASPPLKPTTNLMNFHPKKANRGPKENRNIAHTHGYLSMKINIVSALATGHPAECSNTISGLQVSVSLMKILEIVVTFLLQSTSKVIVL